MTLRSELGGRVQTVFEQVDGLLDSDDALIILFDGRRMVSYSHGLTASPCQLELLGVEVERSIRNAVGVQSTANGRDRRNREEGKKIGNCRGAAGPRQHLHRPDGWGLGRLADVSDQSSRSGAAADGDRRRATGRVLRLASEIA